MDKLIDAFCKWSPIGQGVFVLLLIGMLYQFCKLIPVCFRGWPEDKQ